MPDHNAYSEDVKTEILERLATGETLSSICKSHGMPFMSTVTDWNAKDPEWHAKYTQARELGIHAIVDETVSIADDIIADPDAASRKVRIDARRWLASKLMPNRYGDRTALQMLDENGRPAKAGITIIVDGAPGADPAA